MEKVRYIIIFLILVIFVDLPGYGITYLSLDLQKQKILANDTDKQIATCRFETELEITEIRLYIKKGEAYYGCMRYIGSTGIFMEKGGYGDEYIRMIPEECTYTSTYNEQTGRNEIEVRFVWTTSRIQGEIQALEPILCVNEAGEWQEWYTEGDTYDVEISTTYTSMTREKPLILANDTDRQRVRIYLDTKDEEALREIRLCIMKGGNFYGCMRYLTYSGLFLEKSGHGEEYIRIIPEECSYTSEYEEATGITHVQIEYVWTTLPEIGNIEDLVPVVTFLEGTEWSEAYTGDTYDVSYDVEISTEFKGMEIEKDMINSDNEDRQIITAYLDTRDEESIKEIRLYIRKGDTLYGCMRYLVYRDLFIEKPRYGEEYIRLIPEECSYTSEYEEETGITHIEIKFVWATEEITGAIYGLEPALTVLEGTTWTWEYSVGTYNTWYDIGKGHITTEPGDPSAGISEWKWEGINGALHYKLLLYRGGEKYWEYTNGATECSVSQIEPGEYTWELCYMDVEGEWHIDGVGGFTHLEVPEIERVPMTLEKDLIWNQKNTNTI